ncbi:MAG: hypothetical protein HY360_25200 [Verrucomicrobia bacterium]|nr:hypothetical protein [Verrucomicrobiota bacterium]
MNSPTMFPASCDPRTRIIYRRLTSARHPRIPRPPLRPMGGVAQLNGSWYLDVPADMPEMARVAARDLERFMAEGLGVKFAPRRRGRRPITVRIDPALKIAGPVSRRSCSWRVSAEAIHLSGISEWGAACGLYHLQRLLRLNRAPYLAAGRTDAAPALEPSLTCLAFKRGHIDELDYPAAYHENYLVRIARAGYTGFHIDPAFHLFYQSDILPELNHSQVEKNLAILRDVAARARKFALEVFLTLYIHPLAANHPVFRRHPELRGSEIVAANGLRVLCAGRKTVQRFYAEQAARLFRGAPGLGGIFLITGCEGLVHCYTAPASRPQNQTDCPCCRRKDPEKTVAVLVNGMARAVKQVAPKALVVAWSYGAFTWTKTPDAVEHVSLLSRDCAFMGNFDTGETIRREGLRCMSSDYSLALVGPSRVFRRQAQAAARHGLKIMAKVESGCPREIHAMPSIPANTRWVRKYARLLDSGATGAMFAWQFCSFTGSLSEELAGWMSWKPCPPTVELLHRLAVRDFGERNAARVVSAWRWFDRAMDYHPYSAFTSSFRCGPFSIGFAHPLIFDPLQPGELIPSFWLDSPGTKQRPMFITDLAWTHPFGSDACLKSLIKTERAWARGCALLEDASPACLGAGRSSGNRNAPADGQLDAHQALARALLCMVRTAIHTVRFLDIRDRYFREPSNLALARRRLTEMRAIARRELANAEDGLRYLPRNIQIGYDYSNEAGFTEAMVRSKIEHTRWLIDWALPCRMFYHSFAEHGRDEWIRDDGRKWR